MAGLFVDGADRGIRAPDGFEKGEELPLIYVIGHAKSH